MKQLELVPQYVSEQFPANFLGDSRLVKRGCHLFQI